MSEIGYPTSTNRAGAWNVRPDVAKAQAAARRRANPNAHLDIMLQPVKHRGVQSIGLCGLDDQAAKIGDLVNHDPREADRLVRAIKSAVDASRMTHPSFIGCDPREHTISTGETKRRISWCVDLALQMRFDCKWSLERICQHFPVLLGHFLDGEWQSFIKENRKFWAKEKVPRGLGRALAESVA